MNTSPVVLLGVKGRVLALSRADGHILWSTPLPGGVGLGTGFVTLLADGPHVLAHAHGQAHCLELATGRLLWTNELSGCGYGLASLCVPGGPSAPDTAAVEQIHLIQQQSAAHSSAPPSAS